MVKRNKYLERVRYLLQEKLTYMLNNSKEIYIKNTEANSEPS